MDTTQINANLDVSRDTSPSPITTQGTSLNPSIITGTSSPNVEAGTGNKLYRSRTDSMLGGVCGGLARYLGLDPVVVRLTFVVLVLAGFGTGLLIYLIMWLVVPLEGQGGSVPLAQTMHSSSDEIARSAQSFGNDLGQGTDARGQLALLVGAALLLLGLIFLAQNLFGWWLPWLGMGTLWPLLLIVAGIALVLRRSRSREV